MVVRPSPTPARSTAISDVEAATFDLDGSPSITRITIPTCRVQYPGRPNRCMCRLLPCPRGLPRAKDGSASASTLSRPARTSLALQPAGSLDRPRRPLSRGFGPASYPAEPLVSFQINRQLSGWNLPPLVTRAFEAHSCPRRTPKDQAKTPFLSALRGLRVDDRHRRACFTPLLLAHRHVQRVMDALQGAVPSSR